ncbi:hypothetical protein LL965_20385 [Xanthomonas cassavae CFBP 4642]|uniref:Uncharacterized protein n=1 Tax=Xanthomonas cassavae CFBP 4642 TaxID=1219375 RepID=A0ABS8HJB8_9XANT|nr:hypothetical protein [Xanthomonas cassavae]MCC4622295.1 hypothetical protein [Xanthomonas cassavae CFBP 4642]
MQLINERAQCVLGPLPRNGLLVQVKRALERAPWMQPVQQAPTLDDDAHTALRAPIAERKDPAMSKPTPPSIENGLPAPPVPQKLRELLKDYPELIERLQQQLNFAVQRPSKVTPPFEWAIWMLEDELDSFISEAREELEHAVSSGDAERIKSAEQKDILILKASSKYKWISDDDFGSYFN